MKTDTRIVIADDHPVYRKGLLSVLASSPGLNVVSEAENGQEAVEQIQAFRPEVAILDLEMPIKGGIEVMRLIQEERLPVGVIILTMHKDERFLNAALNCGAKGYVLKDSAVDNIIAAVKAVAAGEYFVSPELSTYLISRRARLERLRKQNPSLEKLTPAERQVLRLIANNKTSKEIGEELYISPRTVDKHRANISDKLNLHGSHALLSFALKHESELS